MPPAIVIRLELERRPVVYAEVMNEGEEIRLVDWLRWHPDQLELLERAVELGTQERAA